MGCYDCRTIFQEMVSMDTLILQMMTQAQKLVNADRASLFLVDNKNHQLYAREIFSSFHCDITMHNFRIFDISQNVSEDEAGNIKSNYNEIR